MIKFKKSEKREESKSWIVKISDYDSKPKT